LASDEWIWLDAAPSPARRTPTRRERLIDGVLAARPLRNVIDVEQIGLSQGTTRIRQRAAVLLAAFDQAIDAAFAAGALGESGLSESGDSP
jgi:hypothetical protein